MGDVHYMISEAAKQVGVEPHALRYWEDELALKIGRTEMGHRYYTRENIRLFSCIKKLKEQGISLKEIKAVIPDMIHTKKELESRTKKKAETAVPKPTEPSENEEASLQTLMENVLRANNEVLCTLISEQTALLLKEKESRDEEHYRNLDMLIRRQQELRRDTGKSRLFRRLQKTACPV